MSKFTKHVLSSILLGSVLTTAGAASAAKTAYSGWICVEAADSTPEITYQDFGAVRNGASAQTIFCPVARTLVGSDMDIGDWDITVDRRGTAGSWDVQIWSLNEAGDSGFSNTITVPASPSSGAVSLDGGTVTSAFVDGQLYVLTTMPANTELRRISVNENIP
jgi:hypothetical protein